MGVEWMLRPWRATSRVALTHLHGHQVNGLATASFAMTQCGHVQLSPMAMTWLIDPEVPLIRQGRRRDLQRAERRTLRVIQLGFRRAQH